MQNALETLRKEAQRLRQQYESTRGTIGEIEVQIRRIERALAILNGEKPPRRRRPRPSSTTLSGEEVVAHVQSILAAEGPQREPELLSRVNEIAAEQGRSRKGLHFTFARAIRNERFQWTGARWSLKMSRT